VLGFSQTLVEPLDPIAYPEVPCRMEPGDLTLHHTNTVHRSDGNPSPRPRRMVSLIYRSSLAVRNETQYAAVEHARKTLHGGVRRDTNRCL
jgi:phytanoyl-CoA hydroxylase